MKNKPFNKRSILSKLILLLFIGTAPLLSCKKFLEADIDNRSSVTSINDLERSIITLEPYSDYHFTDLLSDDYSYKDIAGHVVREFNEKLRPIFTFQIMKQSMNRNEMLAQGMNPNTAFLRYYFRINNANLLIDRAIKLRGSGADVTRINNVIGHATAIKAYCNLMLTDLFGKQYNNATAATDLAVPYIGEYNSTAVVNRPRATVEFMYNQVEADFISAASLIDEKNATTNSKFYFSKRSIYGLLSRFYLNKKDWANSIRYADLVLAADKTPLNVKSIKTASNNNSEVYSKSYFDPANTAYLLMGNNTYQVIAFFWSGYYPYPFMQFYGDNTSVGRFGVYTTDEMIQTSPLFSDKIPQKFLYFFSAANRNMNMPLITVDEVIFNKAESSIENEGSANAVVKADLSLMIDNLPFTNAATNTLKTELTALAGRDAAIAYLLKLKRYRFFAEGMRWFDMKRHHLPVTHNYNGTDYVIDGTNANDYVIKLPLEEIQFNGDIQ